VQDRVGGLEVNVQDGSWVEVTATPDQIIVNAADWLAHLSGGRWRSSPHRVKNRSGHHRYSLAYFFDPCMEAEAVPLTGDGKQLVYSDYLLSRFNTNYSYREGR
jgi:isopenicillin N synthase-like dioxygenase